MHSSVETVSTPRDLMAGPQLERIRAVAAEIIDLAQDALVRRGAQIVDARMHVRVH